MKKLVRTFIRIWETLFFDPISIMNKWRGLPFFLRDFILYSRAENNSQFPIKFRNLFPVLQDRFALAGGVRGHYFLQDLWAAKVIYDLNIKEHIDVASRLDGFVAHLLCFTRVVYVDIRPLGIKVEGLRYQEGSITSLPFADNSISSLSCLHVIEHIGLGRYGDQVDIDGWSKGCKELQRVLAPGGKLILGVPVGGEGVCFNAHRIFDPQSILSEFDGLLMTSFSLIDDSGDCIHENASFQRAKDCKYGCGLYIFKKEADCDLGISIPKT
jgi:SAM-dependent methyltransferase